MSDNNTSGNLDANEQLTTRFVAPDMQRAMRTLADELGEDAVLVSCRQHDDGVEVVGMRAGVELPTDNINELHSDRRRGDRRQSGRRDSDIESAARVEQVLGGVDKETADTRSAAAALAEKIGQLGVNGVPSDVTDESAANRDQVLEELKSLRQSLSMMLSENTQASNSLPAPNEYIVVNRLVELGFSLDLARQLVSSVTTLQDSPIETLWASVRERVAEVLPCYEQDMILHGGVVALDGGNGSGKSSVMIKLASRWANLHGADTVMLVTDQGNRSVAVEQFAQLCGVFLYQINEHTEPANLKLLASQYRCVITDVAHDEQVSIDSGLAVSKRLLVLPAVYHKRYLENIVGRYRDDSTVGVVVSYFDEAVNLGELLSRLIYERMPIAYLSSEGIMPDGIDLPAKAYIVDKLFLGSGEAGVDQSNTDNAISALNEEEIQLKAPLASVSGTLD